MVKNVSKKNFHKNFIGSDYEFQEERINLSSTIDNEYDGVSMSASIEGDRVVSNTTIKMNLQNCTQPLKASMIEEVVMEIKQNKLIKSEADKEYLVRKMQNYKIQNEIMLSTLSSNNEKSKFLSSNHGSTFSAFTDKSV